MARVARRSRSSGTAAKAGALVDGIATIVSTARLQCKPGRCACVSGPARWPMVVRMFEAVVDSRDRRSLGRRARRRAAGGGHPRRRPAGHPGRRRHREDPDADRRVAHLLTEGVDPTGCCCSPSPAGPPTTCWPGRGDVHPAGAGRAGCRAAPSMPSRTNWWPGTPKHSACRRACRCSTRPTSTDVMDLLRTTTGSTGDRRVRMPRAATLVDIYSRSVSTGRPARDVIATDFPWCEPHRRADHGAAPGVRRPQARAAGCSTSTTCCWPGAACWPTRSSVRRSPAAGTTCWSTSTRTSTRPRSTSSRALRPDGRGLTVVGDDAQAVYGFRGARQ